MTIDWAAFSPWSALTGGALIGAAAALLVLTRGRIAGITGIAGGLFLSAAPGDRSWRLAFLGGLVAAPVIASLVGSPAVVHLEASPVLLLGAGLAVGIGTRLANGCTSGHGVCGLARRSPRSLVATIAFVAAGIATVVVMRLR